MTAQRHLIFWGLAFAAFLLLVWVFKSVLLPFVLGMVIAYLLNPAVNSLSNFRLSRGPAALLIITSFFVIVGGILALITPIVCRELIEFSADVPLYVDRFWVMITPVSERIQTMIGLRDQADLQELIGEHAATAADVAKNIAGGMVQGGQAMLHFLAVAFITPIVAYFMMKEWPRITAWVVDLLPRRDKDTIMGLLREIDTKLAGFIRGQVTVAVILAIAYALALSFAKLEYGFIIGLVAGLLSVIPMVGSVLGLVAGVLVAWLQTGDWQFVLLIAGIFLGGQLIEGNILTPKLVGDRIGLHPLWVFFALMAGGSLFGFLGMLLAVPVAAVASVLISFGLRLYKNSPYYTGGKRG